MNDSNELKKAYTVACTNLVRYLENGIGEEEKDNARLAMMTVTAYARLRASENSSKALTFAVSRAMANDTAELKELVEKQIPEFANQDLVVG